MSGNDSINANSVMESIIGKYIMDYKNGRIIHEPPKFWNFGKTDSEENNLKGLTVERSNNEKPAPVNNNNNNKNKGIMNEDSFDEATRYLNGLNIKHNTKLLDIAQDSLGTIEVTMPEYRKMTPKQQEKTNIHLIGNNGNSNEAWCAHTVSYLLGKAGVNFGGHKKAVSQFINWAKSLKIYKPIAPNDVIIADYLSAREIRKSQIKKQLPSMHEGDLIVWKAKYVARVEGGKVVEAEKSHIGIIESVDFVKGIVTVIEGNANVDQTGTSFERKPVTKSAEGKNGAQVVGEWQEVNPRDGIIRKTYTIDDLASFGYSGYIDMQKLVK